MKSITAYLTSAGITGDAATAATTALQALLSDAQADISTANASAEAARQQVQAEIRENQQARALAGAFRKVAERAGVDLSDLSDSSLSAERRRELADAATQGVLTFVGSAGEQASEAAGILKASGFDLDAYQKAGKDKRQEIARQFAEGVTGNQARLRLAERNEALRELGLDTKKASAILGDITLEKGKVSVTENGQPVEKETYGVKAADGTFTPVDRLFQEKGFSLSDLAPARDSSQQQEQPAPLWVPQPGSGVIQTTTTLTDADADKARLQSGHYPVF